MALVQEFWSPDRSVPLPQILGSLRRGLGDPTMVVAPRDMWWAVQTPVGPASTWWSTRPARHEREGARSSHDLAHEQADQAVNGVAGVPIDVVRLEARGPGAEWFAGKLPSILGDGDDVSGFVPHHDAISQALTRRTHRDWRTPRTGIVFMSLVPSVLEQKVTGKQAFAGYRRLVRRFGARVEFSDEALAAAGQHARAVQRLVAPPAVEGWRRVPSWEWLQAGVEPAQSHTVMRACEVAPALEKSVGLPMAQAHRRLRSVPGIGIWTTAKVAQTALGDADAPTFADFHVAKQIGHAVLGYDVDDAGMASILEPYRGHRFRAERLLLAGGPSRPRHGERMALPTHLPNRALA